MKKQTEKETLGQQKVKVATGLELITLKELELEAVSHDVSQEYAVWIRALLQNWRQGTVSCKDRSEVNYTNKKPWKQKGTGRARAGSARSPLWRGGGVTFGPQPRVRVLKINKNSRNRVLSALMSEYAQQNRLYRWDWELQQDTPSTSVVYKALDGSGLIDKKTTLFLDRTDIKHWVSIRNIQQVQILAFDDVNAYDLSLGNRIVVLKKDYDMFKDMVKKWN
ncbi:50S ribosomal protein L4 [Candidatus Dependentiae bacterium]|nr:50S ribosomal protein L4 [Candidatus Dependentiae bacterium]